MKTGCSKNAMVYAVSDGGQVSMDVQVYDSTGQYRPDLGNSDIDSVPISFDNPGTYRVRIVVGNNPNCYFDTVVRVYESPVISNIDIQSTLCEHTAFTFSANLATPAYSGLTYWWDFGDGSYNYGNGIDHVYGSAFVFNVKLTVTDRNGCKDSTHKSIRVVGNPLDALGQLTVDDAPICPGSSLILRTPDNPSNDSCSYSWTPCDWVHGPVANVYASGTYIADLTTTIGQCRRQLSRNVSYPHGPFAAILCDSAYCQGDMASIIGNIGPQYSYQWDLYSNHTHDVQNTPNLNCQLTDTGRYRVILSVSDGDGCISADTAFFYVHSNPDPPTIDFCGNHCITSGPVDLCSTSGMSLLWSNGTAGSATQYYSDGWAGAYYFDPATGCKSSVASIEIPQAPDFGALLTGCYQLCKNWMPLKLPLFSLGTTTALSWKWMLEQSAVDNGTIPPAPCLLPIPTSGDYSLYVSYDNTGCDAHSPTLTIEPKDCKPDESFTTSRSVYGVLSKVTCDLNDCNLVYSLDVTLCNDTGNPFTIDGIRPQGSVSYHLLSPLPVVLNPGARVTVCLTVRYDFTQSGIIPFDLFSGSVLLGNFYADLSDWRECVDPDTCKMLLVDTLVHLRPDISVAGQTAFYDVNLTFPSSVGNVLAVWCDHGPIIDGRFSSPCYTGLLMLDYGMLTQMVVADTGFCIHALCCTEDKLCVTDVCFPIRDLWEQCQALKDDGQPKSASYMNGTAMSETGTAYMLVPNPATGQVRVVNARTRADAADLSSVEVFSMLGQVVLSVQSANSLDVSMLAAGIYIVKVVAADGTYEYLRLVKQ